MMKYNQIMENITVTPALRARVLDALRTAQKKRRPPIYQIAGTLAACLVLLVIERTIWLIWGRCPHCHALIWRQHGKYCQECGKNLYEEDGR